jgi:hypothetical protein
MVDPEELAKYDCMTPTSLDFLADYMDAIQRMDWHLDLDQSAGVPQAPTVYYAGDVESNPSLARPYGIRPVTFHSFANNILAYDMNLPAGTSYYHKPCGSWLIKQIYAINYGVTDALSPFPLHSLVNVMSATKINNTVSFNVPWTLPLLLNMVDPEELAKYDCMAPTSLDFLADYMDAIQRMEWHMYMPTDGVSQYNQLYITAALTPLRPSLCTAW